MAAATHQALDEVRRGLADLVAQGLLLPIGVDRYHRILDGHGLSKYVTTAHPVRRAMIAWYLTHAAAADVAINPHSRRYSPVYQGLTAHPFPTARAAHTWWAHAQSNIVAAQQVASDEGWDDLVYQLAEAVWNPLRATYSDDLVHTLRVGVHAARRSAHLLETVFHARLAYAESVRQRHESAIAAATHAVHQASTCGDSGVQAMALSARAHAHLAAGQSDPALADLTAALPLEQKSGSTRRMALWRRRMGRVYTATGDYNLAIQHLHEAARLLDGTGDHLTHARTLTHLAETRLRTGQPIQALIALRLIKSTAISDATPRYRVHALTIEGQAHAQRGDTTLADHAYSQAIALCDLHLPESTRDRTHVHHLRDQQAGTSRPRWPADDLTLQ
ncbi:tetratricopeptide repeat protein [Kibdelosporangium phytohabitans]|uniref:tetratricopeptide repeat protein n=1 Tax=Kibdelosporangium phytohabitans TaxID=860235 RepID=UPI0012FA13DA|nr:tetratricopeptide repeat protein [Kibdelosporangium phytohabitans]